MGIFYPEAFRLWLPYHLLVFKGDGGLAVVHAIPDVVFILQDALYLYVSGKMPISLLVVR